MKTTMTATLAAAGLAALLTGGPAGPALAQDRGGTSGEARPPATDGAAHGAAETGDASGGAATEAYRAANAAMHESMDIAFTGDPDIDFARGMIGHHQGAIAMARIVLEHGEDPELQALAEEIIAAQEAEIAFLRDWLAEHGE